MATNVKKESNSDVDRMEPNVLVQLPDANKLKGGYGTGRRKTR